MMCRFFFILPVALSSFLFFSDISAQGKLAYGVKSGISFSKQNIRYDFLGGDFRGNLPTSSKAGASIGIMTEVSMSASTALLVEIRYVQKGTRHQIFATNERGEFLGIWEATEKADYISLPVLFQKQFRAANAMPYLAAGPRLDYLIMKSAQPGYTQLKSYDFGVSIALGTELPISPTLNSIFELRYNHSFADASKADAVVVRNQSFEFLVGLKL